jgi:hypothetical protein
LSDALDGVVTGSPPPYVGVEEPVFIGKARGLLTGEVAAKDLVKRAADVATATTLAKTWTGLRQHADRYADLLLELEALRPSMTTADLRLLDKAKQVVSEGRWDLWSATDAADLLHRTTAAELDEADAAVGSLVFLLPDPVVVTGVIPVEDLNLAFNPGDGAPAAASVVAALGSLTSHIGDAIQSIAESATVRDVIDRTLSAFTVTLAFALSIWAALLTLYFDKPFGTWRDYLTLLVWAVATAGAVDGINTALNKLGPPKPDKAEVKPAAT